MSRVRRDFWETNLLAVQEAVIHGVTAKTAKSKDVHWDIWLSFCRQAGIDPFLRSFQDPLPFLQVFAHCYREGVIAPSKKRVTADYVSSVLNSVASKFRRVGAPDPRRTPFDGKIDYRVAQQLRCYKKTDAPPARVRPVPITLISYLLNLAYLNPTRSASECAFADMACVAFFFLLRQKRSPLPRHPPP